MQKKNFTSTIHFQGSSYNIGNKEDVRQVLLEFRLHNSLWKALETYLGQQFEELQRGQQEVLQQIAHLAKENYSALELEHQLETTEKEKQVLIV